jgi:hypothetical protein
MVVPVVLNGLELCNKKVNAFICKYYNLMYGSKLWQIFIHVNNQNSIHFVFYSINYYIGRPAEFKEER